MNKLGTSTIVIDTDLALLERDLKKAKQVIAKEMQAVQKDISKAMQFAGGTVKSFTGIASQEIFKFAGGVSGIAKKVKEVGTAVQGEFQTGFQKGLGAAATGVGTVLESVAELDLSMTDLLSPMGVATVGFDILRKVAKDNIDVIIDAVTDVINEFVELYNSSVAFRGVVETIRAQFLILYDVIKFVAKALFTTFGTIGKVIKAAFTGDFKAIGGIIKDGFAEAFDNVKDLAGDVGETIGGAISNTLNNRLKRVRREDVANFFNGFINDAKEAGERIGVAALSALEEIGSISAPDAPALDFKLPELKDIADLKEFDALKDIKQQLKDAAELNRAFGESFDLPAEKIKILEDGIKSLIGNGFAAASPQVQGLITQMEELQSTVSATTIDIAAGLNAIVDSFLDSVSEAIIAGQSLGGVLSAGLKGALGTLGTLMINLGKVAIKTALGIKAIQASLQSLNPVVAAIAGGALLTFGSLIKSKVSDLGAPALAKGGLAFGETLAIVGDNPNAAVDPEVIAPLSKLKDMLGGGLGGDIVLRSIIKGDDILLVGERAAANQRRITGR